jgi:hypothetical protein
MPVADRIIGYREIAAITGKSRRTIRRWFKDGPLRDVKVPGVAGCWESDLIAALGWRGTGSLVVDDPVDADNGLDDAPRRPAGRGRCRPRLTLARSRISAVLVNTRSVRWRCSSLLWAHEWPRMAASIFRREGSTRLCLMNS